MTLRHGSALAVNQTHCSFARRVVAPLRRRGHRVVLFVVPTDDHHEDRHHRQSEDEDASSSDSDGGGGDGFVNVDAASDAASDDDDVAERTGAGAVADETLTLALERLRRTHDTEYVLATDALGDGPSPRCASSLQDRLAPPTRSARGKGEREGITVFS